MSQIEIVEGDLLDQDVGVIVNAWNRNIIGWWLLLPQCLSGASEHRAAYYLQVSSGADRTGAGGIINELLHQR